MAKRERQTPPKGAPAAKPGPKLKACPCGKVPEKLIVEVLDTGKYGTVSGSCCTLWQTEYRNSFERDGDKIQALATAAWNKAPRG